VGCTVLNKPEDARLAVDVPGWRPDLTAEIDLIEEIARLHGYDNFPVNLRPFRVGRLADPPMERAIALVRDGLAGLGLLEATMLSLGPTEGEASVRLVNPLSAEDAYLRQTLLPGLGRAVETNWSRQVREIRLFEIGTGFRAKGMGGRPSESTRVAAVLSGARVAPHWTDAGKAPETDLWDLRALFEAAVALANPSATVQVDAGGWIARGSDGGIVGHARRLDLDPPAWAAPVFGLEVVISDAPRPPVRHAPLPTTPSSWRDLNLLLAPATSAAEVMRVMRSSGKLLESVGVVSEFRAEHLGENRRAVQFRLVFRAPDRTIRDEDVDAALSRILKALERELDAKLRTS
jgi:phenylalanyl-tRNA synthetase beta chain